MAKYGSTLDAGNVQHVINRIADYPEIIKAVHELDRNRDHILVSRDMLLYDTNKLIMTVMRTGGAPSGSDTERSG